MTIKKDNVKKKINLNIDIYLKKKKLNGRIRRIIDKQKSTKHNK